MKVLIMGAGGQGAPAAMTYTRIKEVSSVKLADFDTGVLKKAEEKIASSKLTTCFVDARDIDQIAAAAEDVDVIVDLLASGFTENVMRAAIKAKVHYVNTAFDEWLLEGYAENDVTLGADPILMEEFRAAGKTAIWGCGYSPGMATNIMARKLADDFDVLEDINIFLIKKNMSHDPEMEALYPWNPGWNPGMALEDQMYPKYEYKDGSFIKMTETFAQAEVKEFPQPFGRMLVAAHCHEETYGMPHFFADKGLKHLSFKYYIDKAIGILLSSGLGSEEKVKVGDAMVSPKDLMVAITPKPSDAFFNEDPADFPEKDKNVLMNIIVEMSGTKDGEPLKYRVTSPENHIEYPRQKMYDLYGTSIVGVALPALVGGMMAAEGAKKGVIHAHELDPERFFGLLRRIGYDNEWNIEKL